MSVDPRLVRAAAHALAGAEAARCPGLAGVQTPEELVEQLDRAGWTAACLRALRDRRRAEAHEWPMTVPADLRRSVGPALLHAWVWRCEALLALDAADAGVRDHTRPLDREDLRLLGERPPHHGAVG